MSCSDPSSRAMMGEPRRPTTRPSRGRQMLLACAVSFCFCGFPLILGEVASSYLWEVRREALEREQFAALQAEVTRLLGLADAEDLIKPALRRLVERAEVQSCPHRWVYPRLRALVRRYPGLFSFFLADDRDRVIWKSDPGESARLATRFLQRLREIERGERSRLDLKEAPPLALLLGGRPGQPKFENIGQGWTDINRLPRKTWLFTHLGTRFALLAFVHRQGFSPDLGIRSRVAAPPRGEITLHLLDTYAMTLSGPGDEAFRRQAIPVVLRGERENTPCLREGGRLWAMGLVDSRYRVLASCPDRVSDLPARHRTQYRGFAVGFFLLITLTILMVHRMDPPPWISWRWKLTVVFGFASFLPVFVAFFLLAAYLREREVLLVDQAHRAAESILQTLDSQLVRVFRMCEVRLQHLLRSSTPRTPAGQARLQADLEAFRRRYHCRTIQILDHQGREILLRNGTGLRPGEQQWRKLISGLLGEVLAQVRGDASDLGKGGNAGGLARSQVAASLLLARDPADLLADLLAGLGTLQRLHVGTMDTYIFYDVVGPRQGKPDQIVGIGWDVDDLIALYLGRFLPMKPLDDGTELFCARLTRVHRTRTRVVTEVPTERSANQSRGKPRRRRQRVRESFFPMFPRRPVGTDFHRIFQRFRAQRQLCHGRIDYKGQPALLTCVPGQGLPGFGFFAVRPFAPLAAQITALRRTLLAFALLIAAFTGLVSVLLARKFLEPVREVARGVEAVQGKDFRYRLPVLDRDEFGDLAVLFNRMMEGMHELDMARQVQERLFPRQPLVLGEMRAFGRSLPASELGGDYFDYLAFGPGRLLVLQGDVTGHGVPAALVMAMAKAIITEAAARQSSLEDLMTALHRAIRHGGGESLFMTLGVLLIDATTGQATFCNCGHPYPWRFRPGQPPVAVALPGSPVGLRSVFKGRFGDFQFEPGERWVFYSDGLFESLGTASLSGFDVLGQFLAERAALPLEEACRRCLDEHPVVQAGGSLPDDFTVLMVERAIAGGGAPRAPNAH